MSSPTTCTSAHAPKRARCEEMGVEITTLREQVATLTAERDALAKRAGVALGIVRGETDRLMKDRNQLHGVLAELTDFLNGGDYLVDDEDLAALWESAVAVLDHDEKAVPT